MEKQFELLVAYENAKEKQEKTTDENCVIIATFSLVKSREVRAQSGYAKRPKVNRRQLREQNLKLGTWILAQLTNKRENFIGILLKGLHRRREKRFGPCQKKRERLRRPSMAKSRGTRLN